jgi:hypothetical protein
MPLLVQFSHKFFWQLYSPALFEILGRDFGNLTTLLCDDFMLSTYSYIANSCGDVSLYSKHLYGHFTLQLLSYLFYGYCQQLLCKIFTQCTGMLLVLKTFYGRLFGYLVSP